MAIPKIIHWCWFGRNPLPDSVKKCIDSWYKYCPDYEIIRWDEDNFDYSVCEYAREGYNAGKWSFVSDYARFKVVYDYGGIYLDTDVELIKSIDPLLDYKGFFGFEKPHTVASGLGFGAEKHNSIIAENVNGILSFPFWVDGKVNSQIFLKETTKIFMNHGLVQDTGKIQVIDGIAVLPQEYLCPKDFEMERTKITKNTYSIHHYDSTWFSAERMEEHKRAVKQRRIEKRFGKTGYKIYLTLVYLFKQGGLREVLQKKLHRFS